MNTTTFIFTRHAESSKNLRHITGGMGEKLTETGIQQALKLSEFLLRQDIPIHNVTLISSKILQAIQTTEILSKAFKIPFTITEGLSPADMGIISGLSAENIKLKYPDISLQLELWHNKEIEAIDLMIGGMEPPDLFWSRVLTYLDSLRNNDFNVIVATRSILVLIANFVCGANPKKGGGYKHVTIRHCETIAFRCGDKISDVSFLPNLTTASLRT